jgi:uncharacterized protein
MLLTRRTLYTLSWSIVLIALSACSSLQTAPNQDRPTEVVIYSAGQGSAFLPYAQGVAGYLNSHKGKASAVESKGSIENIQKIDEPVGTGAARLGTVFLGTAFEAINGTGTWTLGKKFTDLRALFPMYETSFQIVTLKSSGISSLAQLAGKRVGVGPGGGPAESFFKGLADVTNLKVETVSGTPAALVAELLAGKIDALWQGAALPIPPIKQIADSVDAVVFGLNDAEQLAMLKRFPFLSPATVSANMYRGQGNPLKSVAAWNFMMANKSLPDADAYFITKTILSAADPKAIAASAGPTLTTNAVTNVVVPFHTGALKFYKERGVFDSK